MEVQLSPVTTNMAARPYYVYDSAVAAAATHSPAWFLSGAYHPPLPGNSNADGLLNGIGDNGESGTEISGEALTVALDVIQAWAVLLTLGFTLIIFVFLAFCVCSKKDDGYDEFEISQGITTVKICHDGGENGVSLIPRINGSGTESLKATDETSEASSRYTLQRELPAIPTSTSLNRNEAPIAGGKSERPVSQHSSDLYASVNDSAQGSSSFKLIGGVQVLPAGAIPSGGRAAVMKESVSSPEGEKVVQEIKKDATKKTKDDLTFTQAKMTHTFSQVSKVEHPYAKVTSQKGHETDTDSYEDSKPISKDIRKCESEARYQSVPRVLETKKEERSAPLSSHLSTDHSSKVDKVSGGTSMTGHTPHLATSITSTTSTHSSRSPTSPPYRSPTSLPQFEAPAPIPAAMAISGRTPANEEMPYMTPPALQPAREPVSQHFSGDSQDSRGYTSISVREPLAALKARQAAEGAIAALGRTSAGKTATNAQGSEGEGYYMTVSDDSADEMYACIYEGGSRGTGSETYAQIEPRPPPPPTSQVPPSVPSAFNLPPASPTGLSSTRLPPDPSPPAPPSVDSLRHVVHSRQASASSSTSTGMGSPVAEKRGTRSPLPPLPQGDSALYSPPEPPIISSQPIPKSPPKPSEKTARSLEEMYAKVLKKHPGHSRGSSSGGVEGSSAAGNLSSSRRGSADIGGGRWPATSPTSSKPKQDMTHSLVDTLTHDAVSGVNRAKSCDVSASWGEFSVESKKMKPSQEIGNYETIPSLYSGSDPGYETVKNAEPPYASVDPAENYPGYETVRGSNIEFEPGYETLKHKEFEPGYETVSELTFKKPSQPPSEPGYESVSTTEYEPGYETVSSKKSSDPGYESVLEKEKVDYDPGYEELSHPMHGRTCSETDPNYEQLKFSSSRRSSGEGDNGYEVVSKGAHVEGTYECVSDYDTQAKTSSKSSVLQEQISSIPLYASVKKKVTPIKEKQVEPLFSVPPKKETNNFSINDTQSILQPSPVENKAASNDTLVDDITESTQDTKPETVENLVEVETSNLINLSKGLDLSDALTSKPNEPETEREKYQVMDSPEEVELPPPGEEGNDIEPPPLPSQELEHMTEEIKAIYKRATTPEIITSPTVPSISEPETPCEEQQQAMVCVTFTAASPPAESPETSSAKSTESSCSSPKDDPRRDSRDSRRDSHSLKEDQDAIEDVIVTAPSQFDDVASSAPPAPPLSTSDIPPPSLDDPLPPPPLPVLDDDLATASPPPPPPPIPDDICTLHDLPPPPLSSTSKDEEEESAGGGGGGGAALNGPDDGGVANHNGPVLLPSLDPLCSSLAAQSDLPLPPPGEEEEQEEEGASKPVCVNGNMNVTINPMAEMEEEEDTVCDQPTLTPTSPPPPPQQPPLLPVLEPLSPPPPAPPAPVLPGSIGESGESQSSGGSTANGNGSVESVVTVDPKSGSDPATTVPPPPAITPLHHSASTSSSDSKHSDSNEGITPV